MGKRIFLYSRFERLWHWIQAFLIIGLLLTGFEVHSTVNWFGFEKAVAWHNNLAWALIGLTVFAIFWHFTTGQWKQYIPTMEKAGAVVCYYTRDIFRGLPHPVEKSPERKLNPLQSFTYLFLKVVLFPLQVLTGILYFYYNLWPQWGIRMHLDLVACLHIAGAFAFMAFLVVHMYLATTGRTPLSHVRAMITGWEDLQE